MDNLNNENMNNENFNNETFPQNTQVGNEPIENTAAEVSLVSPLEQTVVEKKLDENMLASNEVVADVIESTTESTENSNTLQEVENNSEQKTEERKRGFSSSFKRTVAVASIVSILGGSSIGLGYAVGKPFSDKYVRPLITGQTSNSFQTVEPVEINTSTEYMSSNGYYDYVTVIEKVKPAVVTITTVVAAQSGSNFFGGAERPSAGTGIIYQEDETNIFIATNNHVVAGGTAIKVSVMDKEPVSASLIGYDSKSDLAVISIKKEDLTKMGITSVVFGTFGNSDNLKIGEPVVAIGNALGEGNIATNGIITSEPKEITIDGKTLKVIQTNAAINPGNSGGPLVNMRGEIIGINTAKLMQSGTFFSTTTVEGIGYSIPSSVAVPILNEAMTQIERPILGITGGNVREDIASAFNLPFGVLVDMVAEGSAAKKAGIEPYDIITSFNGKAVLNMEQLQKFIGECKIGDKVKIKVLRNGEEVIELEAVLQSKSDTSF